MKELSSTIGKILFYVFIVAVFAWTASLTLAMVRIILPNDPITPYFALALFDGGALTWLMSFIGHAKGLIQRAIAVLLLVLDLAGVVALSAGHLLTGGQQMTNVPQEFGATMVYVLIGATMINLVAIYAFHLADPETMEAIELQTLDDNIKDEAIKQARANVQAEVQGLGAVLAARSVGRLKYSLRLPMSEAEAHEVVNDPEPLVIPAKRIAAAPVGLPAWMLNLKRKFTKAPSPVTTTYEKTTEKPALKREEPQPFVMAVDHRPAGWEIDPKPIDAPFKFKAAVDMGGDPGVYIKAGTEIEARLYDDERYNLSEIGATYAFARVTAEELHYYQTGEDKSGGNNFPWPS